MTAVPSARMAILTATAVPPATSAPEIVRRYLPILERLRFFDVAAWQWAAMVLALIAAVAVGAGVARVSHIASRGLLKRPKSSWFVAMTRAVQNPVASLVALGVFDLAVHLIDLEGRVSEVVDTAARQLLIGASAWFLLAAGGSLALTLEKRLLGLGEYTSRGVRTQLRLARRVGRGVIVLVALALILSGFSAVRTIGVSLLASAGIVGIVVGIAAQKSLGSLVAGIQLAVTQQIRLGDTVVVGSETGTVEELHLSFVVLRLWDMRRLIVPASTFLEQTFQNWTRVRTQLQQAVGRPDLPPAGH